jgi:hypothetical protein
MQQTLTHNTHRMRDIAPLYKQAAVESLNQVAEELRDVVASEISSRFTLDAGYIKSRTTASKADASSMKATVRIQGKALPLIQFNPTQTTEGISVQIERGKTTRIPGAFIAKGKSSGQRNVFRRLLKAEIGGRFKNVRSDRDNRDLMGPRVGRLPITQIPYPGIAKIVRIIGLKGKLLDFIEQRLPEVLTNKLNSRLSA